MCVQESVVVLIVAIYYYEKKKIKKNNNKKKIPGAMLYPIYGNCGISRIKLPRLLNFNISIKYSLRCEWKMSLIEWPDVNYSL